MKTGIERIADERKRQIEKEGWDSKHDSQHIQEELMRVAQLYLTAAEACQCSKLCVTFNGGFRVGEGVPKDFPKTWSKGWWKPSDNPIRNLEKAGALIAAEIDRLQAANSEEQKTIK